MQYNLRKCLSLTVFSLLSLSIGSQTTYAAESFYKCKNGKDETIYSEQPCAAKKHQKITIKDNTLDHTELRKSPMYKAKPPQYDAASNADTVSDSGQPSVTSMKKIEGAGFQPSPPSSNGSSSTTPWP